MFLILFPTIKITDATGIMIVENSGIPSSPASVMSSLSVEGIFSTSHVPVKAFLSSSVLTALILSLVVSIVNPRNDF